MKHKLDLHSNAIDSLNEGLRKFVDARGGEPRAYKFAVLHVAHFLELLLKHAVVLQHPLLVYKNPSSRKVAQEQTIGLWEAVNILGNAGIELQQELVADLQWLKSLRNEIEHYQFEMDVKAVRTAIGRIIRATDDFSTAASLKRLSDCVEEECHEVFEELLDEYKEELANAKADARDDPEASEGYVTHCSHCGEGEVAVRGPTQIHCHFCKEDEAIRECAICGDHYRDSETSVWNDEHEETDYACEYCEARIFGGDD